MKKNTFGPALLILLTSSCLLSCTHHEVEEQPKYTEENYTFHPIYKSTNERHLRLYDPEDPSKNGYTTLTINKDIGGKSFLKIDYESDVNLIGHIYYHNKADVTQTNDEKFYLEKDQKTFRTFLDSFRGGAYGKFDKVIDKITLKSVDSEVEGTVVIKEVSISSRRYDPNYLMYISDGVSELGLTLAYGGAIQSYKRLDANVVEYITDDGYVKIDRDIDPEEVTVIEETPNVVNVYDLGREIQLSYYWYVDESNNYYPKTEKKYPGTLRYNPIQCGSAGDIYPQIVDYSYSKDQIYIKSYGQDWFLENQVDPTYFEVTYRFGENGMIICDTKTINFSEFTGVSQMSPTGQEAPAFYVAQPFNYFYCETSDGIIFDDNVSRDMSNTAKTSAKDNVTGDYFYYLENGKKVTNKWAAFVNENMFGLGLYNPTAKYFDGCRYTKTTLYSDTNRQNSTVKAGFYDEMSSPNGFNPSAHVANADYIGAVAYAAMEDFVPFAFSYAFMVGDTEEMAEAFGHLEETQELYTTQSWRNK